jgi:hypothetical protein
MDSRRLDIPVENSPMERGTWTDAIVVVAHDRDT